MTSGARGPRGSYFEGVVLARLLWTLFVAALMAVVVMRLCAPTLPLNLREFRGPAMGTTYSVKVVAKNLSRKEEATLTEVIEQHLSQVNRLMSTYRPESELSRFKWHRSTQPFVLSPQTLEVFRVAREVSALTGGAFDVTVGPARACPRREHSQKAGDSPIDSFTRMTPFSEAWDKTGVWSQGLTY